MPVDPAHPAPEYRTFSTWGAASDSHFQSRGRWLDMGYALKTGVKSYACVKTEKGSFNVFHLTQVRLLKEPQRSRRILIGRFLGFSDWCGYRQHNGAEIRQLRADDIHGSVKDLIYRQFLYRNRTAGIKVPIKFRVHETEKHKFVADSFFVRAGSLTRYFVLDVDNHRPTRESTEAHLLLVEKLVGLLPHLLKVVGGGRAFFSYTQFAPRGLHVWILLKCQRNTKALHDLVRQFLVTHSDKDLDERLRRSGLVKMGAIEILPTEGHLIRFFGAPDRTVFTTEELKPRDNAFDAKALLDHICDKTPVGNPCGRYGQLARAGLGEDVKGPSTVKIGAEQALLLNDRPTKKDNPFVALVDAALNGVSEPDVLFANFLRPLATALYLRDLHDHPQRDKEVVATVMRWLESKHNGLVNRVEDNNTRNLRGILRRIIKNIAHAPATIHKFWSSVRARDRARPEHRISLVKCMELRLGRPFPVTKENLGEVRRLVEGDGPFVPPSPSLVTLYLPNTVELRLRDHLGTAGVAPGKRTDRIVRFAERLVQEIGLSGQGRVHYSRINDLAGLGQGRQAASRYKRLLVGAGILEPGWDRTLRVGIRSSEYKLREWVMDEVRREMP